MKSVTCYNSNFLKNITQASSVKQMDLAQFFACNFQIHKKAYLQTIKIFTHAPKHPHDRHSY